MAENNLPTQHTWFPDFCLYVPRDRELTTSHDREKSVSLEFFFSTGLSSALWAHKCSVSLSGT